MKVGLPHLYKTRNRVLKRVHRGALAIALALACGAAQAVSSGGSGDGGIQDGKVNYHTIEPAFVVNIIDGNLLRFMQVAVDIVSMDSEAIAAIEDHRAPIRHELLMLFAHRHISEVLGPQQRQQLRRQALERIQATLAEYADIPSNAKQQDAEGNNYPTGVQDVLFTNFVIQ